MILWDLATKQELSRTPKSEASQVTAMLFHPGGKSLAIAFQHPRSIFLWDVSSPMQVKTETTLIGHGDRIQSLAFHPSEDLLASGSEDQLVKLWARSGTKWELRADLPFQGLVHAVRFSPRGSYLAGSDAQGQIQLFESSDNYVLDAKNLVRDFRSGCKPLISPSSKGTRLVFLEWDRPSLAH